MPLNRIFPQLNGVGGGGGVLANPLFRMSDLCCNVTPLLRVVLFPLQSLGNSQREYEKHVLLYSIRNQLRFRNNLGETACLLLCAEINSILTLH